MTLVEIRHGDALELPDDTVLAGGKLAVAEPIEDPVEAVRRAAQQPIEFPPLGQIVVPGDRVVLALGEGLVQSAKVVTGIVLELIEAGVEPEQIVVLRNAADAKLSRSLPTRKLPEPIRTRVTVHVHDPADRESLSLLNVASDDQPIYLNREIVDADVVLPIGMVKPDDSLGYLGVHGVLFPTFSDEVTQQRFLSPRSALSEQQKHLRREEAKEASWLLGVRMSVMLIPGIGEALLHVLVGDADAVESRGQQLCDEQWCFTVPQRASLVVATMPGGRQQQSWSNFARVLNSAMRVVKENGAIAVCCRIKSRPGPSLRRLTRAESLDVAKKAVNNDKTFDALPASQLIRTLQRVHVYLLSDLQEETVQSLGLAYVASADEIARLAARHDSCLVLQNAHQAYPTVASESKA